MKNLYVSLFDAIIMNGQNDKINRIICTACPAKDRSLFSDLSDDELDDILQHKKCTRYRKGQTIFYEGGRPMGLFCIDTGKVKVYKLSAEGKEQILNLAGTGDFLGYRALISEEFYNTSATALEESTICFIPQSVFFRTLGNPVFFSKFTKHLAHELGVMEQRLATIAQKSVRCRLASTLLMLQETYSMEGNQSNIIDIALSREDLASIVGTATETVIRALSDFKGQRLIASEGRRIKIIDPKGLVREAKLFN